MFIIIAVICFLINCKVHSELKYGLIGHGLDLQDFQLEFVMTLSLLLAMH